MRLIRAMKIETHHAHVVARQTQYFKAKVLHSIRILASTVVHVRSDRARGREGSKMADFQSILAALLSPDNDMRTRAEVWSTIVHQFIPSSDNL